MKEYSWLGLYKKDKHPHKKVVYSLTIIILPSGSVHNAESIWWRICVGPRS